MAQEQKISNGVRKSDIIAAFIIGEAVSLILLGLSKNIEELKAISFLWVLTLILPVLSIIGILIAQVLAKKIPVIFQIAKFFLVGVLNTFIDLGILNLLMGIFLIFAGWQYSVFKALSFSIAVINSYFWNKFWTFQKKETAASGKEFGKFYLITAIGILINVSIASFIVSVIGPQFGISKILWANIGAISAVVCVATWNFLGYKLIVFKK
jgi:putative flippase GtrA